MGNQTSHAARRQTEDVQRNPSRLQMTTASFTQHEDIPHQTIMHLQRTIGNRAVANLLTQNVPFLSRKTNETESKSHTHGCSCPTCSPSPVPEKIQLKSEQTIIQRCSACENDDCDNGEICGNEPDIGSSRISFGGSYRENRSNAVRSAEERSRFSHVTRDANVNSILQNGLMTNYGGIGGASQAIGSQQFQQHSQGHVHLGQDTGLSDNRPSQFYQQFYGSQGIPNTTLTVYPGRQQLSQLHDDPDDTQGQRYRTTVDVPPSQIHPMPISVRPSGTIGVDYAPSQALSAVRQQLPPSFSGMSNSEMTSSLGSNIPNREMILAATSREEIGDIARRLRELARGGQFSNGTSQEYRELTNLIAQRMSSM
ncbi:hypothetical protein [Paenibacillus sp. SI8]|uniref:hypothetical protein n=1 Tax=unclassified Paenibacillus TaxID=185978 RepID=UPI0034651257